MVTTEDIEHLNGAEVLDTDGDRIGQVHDVYLDDRTGQPNWVTVKTGWFGLRESFVPLDRAQLSGNQLRVPLDQALIKDAPTFDASAPLSPQDEDALYTHYSRADDPTRSPTPTPTIGPADRLSDGTAPVPTRLRRHVPGETTGPRPAPVPGFVGALICQRCGGYVAEDRMDLHRAFHREAEPEVGTFDRHDVPVDDPAPTDRPLPTQQHNGLSRSART